MTPEEWKELAEMFLNLETLERYHILLTKTQDEEEHPEDYDGPCFCALCRSYADRG